jgi:membrane protease YdiL (CAAX protease family)
MGGLNQGFCGEWSKTVGGRSRRGAKATYSPQIAGESLNLGQFNSIRGKLGALQIWLALTWSLAALGEEMAYRGYVLNRLGDLPERSKAAWILRPIFRFLPFVFGHGYQGVIGAVDNVLWRVVS